MRSFAYALAGIASAVREERHMRIHLAAGFYVVEAGLVLHITVPEWAAVLICIALVLSLELVNTAVERLCDRVTVEGDALIGKAKDCCAGAVLFAAVISAAVGCAAFFSDGRPGAAFDFFAKNPMAAGITVLTLPAWIYFIFRKRRSCQ